MNRCIRILFRAIPLIMALFCFGYGAFIYGYGSGTSRFVAGPVVFSLGMICLALFCMATLLIQQMSHSCNRVVKYALPVLGFLAAGVTIIEGIYLFNGAPTSTDFVAGHIIAGVGLITVCVATAATSSTRFTFIPANSVSMGNAVPEGAFSVSQERTMETIVIITSLVAWIWAFTLLGNSHAHSVYFIAGHVLAGIACICTSLMALVSTIVRQIRNVYTEKERSLWLELVLLMGTIAFVWGLFVLFSDSSSTNGVIGYIMIGLGLVCYSISSKVILLACIWKRAFKLANRIPLIPAFTALACLFLAAFVLELAMVHPDYLIPARVLVGLGAICFTQFSIVSILESGTSPKG